MAGKVFLRKRKADGCDMRRIRGISDALHKSYET
jgi:hypothetical protein